MSLVDTSVRFEPVPDVLSNQATNSRPREYSLVFASALVVVADGLILLGTGISIFWSYVGWENYEHYALALVAPATAAIIAFNHSGLYDAGAIFNPKPKIPRIAGILSIIFLAFLAIAFALKISEQFSRVWLFSWFLSSLILISLERIFYRSLLGRWARSGQLSRNIVVVGNGEQAKRLLNKLHQTKEPWLRVVGIFDERKGRDMSAFNGFPILGTVDDLLHYARNNRVDDIIVTLPWNADKRLFEIIRKLRELPVHVRLGSDLAGFMTLNSNFSSICGVPMIDVVKKPIDGWRYLAKLTEDKILAFLFLVLFSPFMLFIALAIKLESAGPVLFRQKRYGFNNKEFQVFKFRSMFHRDRPENGVPQAKQDDPRVTRVGAFLRRTSLDELPQFFNVLGGTMSIVGPRPHAVEHNHEYSQIIGGYFARHRVKPGITGWAQVNGFRGETNTTEKMQSRVEHDVYYIENWSLIFDAKILAMTVPIAVSQKNAY